MDIITIFSWLFGRALLKKPAQDNNKLMRKMWLLKHLILRRICFNIHWIQAAQQAFSGDEFEALRSAEELLQQNLKIVEAKKDRYSLLQKMEKIRR